MAAIMPDHITALLHAGYTVELSKDEGGVTCFIRVAPGGAGKDWLATAATAAEAVWAASPLHADDEPMPLVTDLVPELTAGLGDVLGEVRAALPTPTLREDVRTLSGDMDDVLDRLDAIEADRRDLSTVIRMAGDLHARMFPDGLLAARGDGPAPAEALHSPVATSPAGGDLQQPDATGSIDSRSWNCATCGQRQIGGQPADSVCRGCGGE